MLILVVLWICFICEGIWGQTWEHLTFVWERLQCPKKTPENYWRSSSCMQLSLYFQFSFLVLDFLTFGRNDVDAAKCLEWLPLPCGSSCCICSQGLNEHFVKEISIVLSQSLISISKLMKDNNSTICHFLETIWIFSFLFLPHNLRHAPGAVHLNYHWTLIAAVCYPSAVRLS